MPVLLTILRLQKPVGCVKQWVLVNTHSTESEGQQRTHRFQNVGTGAVFTTKDEFAKAVPGEYTHFANLQVVLLMPQQFESGVELCASPDVLQDCYCTGPLQRCPTDLMV